MGVEPRVEAGEVGQFDVVVDGEVIASRGGNWFTRGFGLGYPSFDLVLDKIDKRRR